MNTIDCIKNRIENIWINPDLKEIEPFSQIQDIKFVEVRAAQNRLMRFAPFIAKAFPETAEKHGIIESQLIEIANMRQCMNEKGAAIDGRLFLKNDAELPIAGSVKARGGIYEVLKHAESLAMMAGMLKNTDDYSKLAEPEFRDFFSQYTIQVGSTGNLGISIGMMGAKLGFTTIVHMSHDAKAWKKDLLRANGVIVKEYDDDYTKAVSEGRKLSALDKKSYFVDDENSRDLFMGYATAAMRLKVQLYKAGISVDADHPLFVYLPCGVGGAPGGITFGLKEMFGDNVHCFFAEPIEAPSVFLGLLSIKGNASESNTDSAIVNNIVNVYDAGLTCKTQADGLACATASPLSVRFMTDLLSGIGTVSDKAMTDYQKLLYDAEKIYGEVSACAGFGILSKMMRDQNIRKYLEEKDLDNITENITHIVWSTGGSLVPESVRGV